MTDLPMPADIDAHHAHAAHQNGTHVLLDVRTDEEWARGHAAGAAHVPLDELDTNDLDPAMPVITVCRSGGRSAKAARTLAAAGFNVSNLAGGMQSWEELGLPVAGLNGTPGRIA